MNEGYGMEVPSGHDHGQLRQAARYLVVIDAAGGAVARLFSAGRQALAEFDASTEETTSLISGRAASTGAQGPEWDRALAGHSAAERAAAKVYELSI